MPEQDAISQVASLMGDSDAKWKLYPKYFCFEPWDVEERSQDVLDRAASDSIDLNAPDLARCIGSPPYEFQTGYLLSTHFGRVLMAGNRLGKSISVLMEILMTATGEIPFSLRYPRGYDTGIPRLVDKHNIIRWGRRDKDSGLILDHNPGARDDGSWDCGTVKGVGIFPTSKIVPPNSMIRLGSYDSMIKQNWWPAFKGETDTELGAFIPPIFIDRTKGSYSNRGFNEDKKVVHLLRGVWLQVLSYEAEKKGFEGATVPTYLDEEPPKEEILSAVFTHTNRWSLSETPWRGITYSKGLAFPATITPQKKTFHASYYDCPFKTEEDRINIRAELEDKPWEIGARLWGIPTEQEGKPFYDRKKINFWINRYKMPYDLVRFEPVSEWSFIKTDSSSRLPGLMDTEIKKTQAKHEDERSAWRVYEDREAGVGYVEASDQAEGDENPGDAGDKSASCIGRADDDDACKAVIVATLRSTLPTPQFAKECLYAARYYNNALIAPESGRGSSNESFKMIADDWPWWFKDSVIRQSTRKIREQRGFCPTTDRRDAVFETLIREKLEAHDEDEYPEIQDEWILRELAASIVGHTRGGAARCDHPNNGTLDSAMAYGILLYVFQPQFQRQIRCHGGEPTVAHKKSWLEQAAEVAKPKRIVYLGDGLKPLR